MTQPHAVRRQRAAERTARHITLRTLLGRLDHLTPTEADRLRDCVLTELTETEDLRRTISGQTRTVEEMNGRLAAADEVIREVEQERDAAQAELAVSREVARSNRRHVQTIVPELEKAEAARDAWAAEAANQTLRAEQAEAAIARLTTPDAIRAAAFAISDYALTHLGRDLGTIHIEPMAEAGIRAALDGTA